MGHLKIVADYLKRRLESTNLYYIGDLRSEGSSYCFTARIREDVVEVFENSIFNVLKVDTMGTGVYLHIETDAGLIDSMIEKTIIL
jgi:hypothetical protein